MMEAMQQTVEGRRGARSSVKLAKAPERDVFCGKYYNHRCIRKRTNILLSGRRVILTKAREKAEPPYPNFCSHISH